MKRYKLIGSDGTPYESATPGTRGGHRATRIYGRLDCPSALRAIGRGLSRTRVLRRRGHGRRRELPAVCALSSRAVQSVEGYRVNHSRTTAVNAWGYGPTRRRVDAE